MYIAALVVLLVLVSGACVAIYQLLLQQGRLLVRMDSLECHLKAQGLMPNASDGGFPAGSALNDFELPSLSGGTMTLSGHRGRKVLLIFFNPACEFCRAMIPGLAAIEPAGNSTAPLLMVISQGGADENRQLFDAHAVKHPVLLQDKREVAELFRAFATPTGYLVDENGMTIGPLMMGSDRLLEAGRPPQADSPAVVSASGRGFSRQVRESQLVRDGLKAGSPAPPFRLPRVDGAELSSDDLRGQNLLLVFSDPGCVPCDRLAPELERIHRTSTALQVVMISRGESEANRAKIAEFGLTFPVVLQRQWEVSRAYGMFATPIGYLIDDAGILASNVLVGTDQILKACLAV